MNLVLFRVILFDFLIFDILFYFIYGDSCVLTRHSGSCGGFPTCRAGGTFQFVRSRVPNGLPRTGSD